MSRASNRAYVEILPELPARERAVMDVLLKAAEAPGFPGSHRRGPCGMTNRQIAAALGLDRDSISPRTSRLRQKGLICEAGISGSETLYEAALEPNFVKKPAKKPKLSDERIAELVAAFLRWPLPESVCVDPCATIYGEAGRIGTSLLNAEEAEKMIRYLFA